MGKAGGQGFSDVVSRYGAFPRNKFITSLNCQFSKVQMRTSVSITFRYQGVNAERLLKLRNTGLDSGSRFYTRNIERHNILLPLDEIPRLLRLVFLEGKETKAARTTKLPRSGTVTFLRRQLTSNNEFFWRSQVPSTLLRNDGWHFKSKIL